MRIKRELLIVFVFIFTNSLICISQSNPRVYKPFEFEDYSPKWKHVIVDPSIVGDTFVTKLFGIENYFIYDGWSHLTSQPMGNYLMEDDENIYYFRNNYIDHFEGSFVESINKKTGELNWNRAFDLRENDTREFPYGIYLDQSNNIKFVGYKQLKKDSLFSLFWLQATIVNRDLSKSGEILSYTFGDEKDSLSQILHNPISRSMNAETTKLFSYGSNFQYIANGLYNYHSKIIDSLGHLLSIDTLIDTNNKYHLYYSSIVNEVDDNRLLLFRSTVSNIDNRDSFNVVFDITNRKLQIIKSKDITEMVHPGYDFKLEYNDEEYFIVSSHDFIEIDSESVYVQYYYLFNLDGKLLETISFKNFDQNGVLELENPEVFKLKYEKKILLIANGNLKDGYSSLNIYRSTGNGTLDTLKVLKVKTENHKIVPIRIYQFKNGDILLDAEDQNSEYLKNNNRAYAAGLFMCFDAQDLGITTATDNIVIEKTKFNIYPNPTTDEINIDFSSNFNGDVFVVDELGRVVISEKKFGVKNIVLDVSKIERGLYFVRVVSDKEVYKVEVFVKE